jgi:hypothetical protein
MIRSANACCGWMSSGKKILPQIHWRTKNLTELFGRDEATLRAFSLSAANFFSFLFSRLALSLWPAKMPAALRPCSARKRILSPY